MTNAQPALAFARDYDHRRSTKLRSIGKAQGFSAKRFATMWGESRHWLGRGANTIAVTKCCSQHMTLSKANAFCESVTQLTSKPNLVINPTTTMHQKYMYLTTIARVSLVPKT